MADVRLGPDAARYWLAGQGVRVVAPFNLRWLLPAVCRNDPRRWQAVWLVSWPLLASGAVFWARGMGADWWPALAAAAFLVALPGIWGPVSVRPVGVDLPAMALSIWAAGFWVHGWWVPALVVLAWATSGVNGWFYVGNYGVPWFDRQPVLLHRPVTSMFLALAVVTGLIAGWLHFRMDYSGHTEVKNTRRNRALAATPLLAVALIMVLLMVGSMAKGLVQRYPAYTTGKANIAALRSGLSETSCAMADDVLVEADANAGLLTPAAGQRWGRYGPLGGEDPIGFTPNGRNTREPLTPTGP